MSVVKWYHVCLQIRKPGFDSSHLCQHKGHLEMNKETAEKLLELVDLREYLNMRLEHAGYKGNQMAKDLLALRSRAEEILGLKE